MQDTEYIVIPLSYVAYHVFRIQVWNDIPPSNGCCVTIRNKLSEEVYVAVCCCMRSSSSSEELERLRPHSFTPTVLSSAEHNNISTLAKGRLSTSSSSYSIEALIQGHFAVTCV